jgi:DNA end-binding protein Ku
MKKVGVARVVIRTREHLAAVMPEGDALMLILLRYPQELVDASDYNIPEGKVSDYRISERELAMAGQLIESMAGAWKPEQYHDEFRKRLHAVIQKRLKAGGKVAKKEEPAQPDEDAATNVVDFMSLLQKSLSTHKRTPAKSAAAPAKATARKARATKKAPTRTARRVRKAS